MSLLVNWEIERISKAFDRASFDCGEETLNTYLQHHARQNDKKGLATAYIAHLPSSKTIAGFYCISMSEVVYDSVPSQFRAGIPRYPLPVMLIGQLAVDLKFQGQRLGEFLLMDALNRVLLFKQGIGVAGVRVDAMNDKAKAFYQKYGFSQYENAIDSPPFPLLLPISVIDQLASANKAVFAQNQKSGNL